MKPPEEPFHEALTEALFWDNFIQNNLVRASPEELERMPPGILFALTGLWQGRGKYMQDSTAKPEKKQVGKQDARNK